MAGEPRRFRRVGERSVPVVAIEPDRAVGIPRRGHDVEQAVAVEVLDNRSAAEVEGVDAERGGDVHEPADVIRRIERVGRDPVRRVQGRRVVADRHVRKVQEPSDLQVAGTTPQQLGVALGRRRRGGRDLVDAAVTQWKQAAVCVVPLDAVLDFGLAEIRQAAEPQQPRQEAVEPWVPPGGLHCRLDLLDGGVDLPDTQQLEAQCRAGADRLQRRDACGVHTCLQDFDLGAAEERIAACEEFGGDRPELLDRGHGVALADDDRAAGLEGAVPVRCAARQVRPMHLDPVDAFGLAEADVKTWVVGGTVAVRGSDLHRPGRVADHATYPGPDGITAVTIQNTNRDGVALARRIVAKQPGRAVTVDDQDVDVPVVVVVPEGGGPAGLDEGKSGTGLGGHVEETPRFALPQELVRLRVRIVRQGDVGDDLNAAVGDERVEQAVVVIVEQRRAETRGTPRQPGETPLAGHVVEVRALVEIQHV